MSSHDSIVDALQRRADQHLDVAAAQVLTSATHLAFLPAVRPVDLIDGALDRCGTDNDSLRPLLQRARDMAS